MERFRKTVVEGSLQERALAGIDETGSLHHTIIYPDQ